MPAPQSWQLLEPSDAAIFPASQSLQADWPLGAHFPATQRLHTKFWSFVSLEYEPESQGVQVVAAFVTFPVDEPRGQERHSSACGRGAYVPRGHLRHSTSAWLNSPESQVRHDDRSSMDSLPSSQPRHCVAPLRAL